MEAIQVYRLVGNEKIAAGLASDVTILDATRALRSRDSEMSSAPAAGATEQSLPDTVQKLVCRHGVVGLDQQRHQRTAFAWQ
jgi:hypothetical protein